MVANDYFFISYPNSEIGIGYGEGLIEKNHLLVDQNIPPARHDYDCAPSLASRLWRHSI
jgi:hypothetical protein